MGGLVLIFYFFLALAFLFTWSMSTCNPDASYCSSYFKMENNTLKRIKVIHAFATWNEEILVYD